MKSYDQNVIKQRPEIFISSPSLSSAGTVDTTLSGTVNTDGQPIISGGTFSFKPMAGQQLGLNNNRLFFKPGATLELVVFFGAVPETEQTIIADDNSVTGLFFDPTGIKLRLVLDKDGIETPIERTIEVKDWARKFYINLIFSDAQAVLKVDDERALLDYEFPPDSVPQSIHIGSATNTDWFLFDGLGIFADSFDDSRQYVDDIDNGHKIYASTAFQGVTTEFENYGSAWEVEVTGDQFVHNGNIEEWYYVTGFKVPASDLPLKYITVKSTDERTKFQYSIDLGETWIEFRDKDTFVTTADYIPIRYSGFDEKEDFILKFIGVIDSSIQSNTPAILDLNGAAIFPEKIDDSIVNCPDGMWLDNASINGQWLFNTQSVEMVFKPYSGDGYLEIYSDTDGYVRMGSQNVINGFTAYLNGVQVDNMSTVKYGQWNHLVLTKARGGNLSFNSGFEEGSNTGWGSYLATLSVVSSPVHSGTKAGRLVHQGGEEFGNTGNVLVPAKPGDRIYYSAWLKSESDANAFVGTTFWGTDKYSDFLESSNTDVQLIANDDWLYVSGVSVAPAETEWVHVTGGTNNGSTIYIDDASLETLGSFKINSANPKQVDLLVFAGYRNLLTLNDAQTLYKVLYGGDNLSVVESYGIVKEGVYPETGNGYHAYSYNWAVVSSAVH